MNSRYCPTWVPSIMFFISTVALGVRLRSDIDVASSTCALAMSVLTTFVASRKKLSDCTSFESLGDWHTVSLVMVSMSIIGMYVVPSHLRNLSVSYGL